MILFFSDPDTSIHDGVGEENLTEQVDTSQAEDSQPCNRPEQSPQCNTILSKSSTKDIENKDIDAKGNKQVKITETDKSENKQVKAGQKNYGELYEINKQT